MQLLWYILLICKHDHIPTLWQFAKKGSANTIVKIVYDPLEEKLRSHQKLILKSNKHWNYHQWNKKCFQLYITLNELEILKGNGILYINVCEKYWLSTLLMMAIFQEKWFYSWHQTQFSTLFVVALVGWFYLSDNLGNFSEMFFIT